MGGRKREHSGDAFDGGHRGHAHPPPTRFSEHRSGDSRHGHASRPSSSAPLVIAVALTSAFAIVELIGGLWSGSLALLADCGHMATDAGALLFSLAANKVAQRPVSERHSFGLARAAVV
jgi:cobalt-zinc-cadmium efflux system protein